MKQDGIASSFTTLRIILKTLPIIALMLALQGVLMSQTSSSSGARNIVLIHGGFVDGSGWEGVYKALKCSK
jgi:hypothetical protein